ncbi:methyl-accepting chemotaxis protein [Paenibacillus sp. GD4]|nr:methyl-accepting chemotaxis protein [Paenibacillus sp. GD4]MDQ1912467.1 methyl-accepting chemotaxis protein [Paenibacillus sp. GD4]
MKNWRSVTGEWLQRTKKAAASVSAAVGQKRDGAAAAGTKASGQALGADSLLKNPAQSVGMKLFIIFFISILFFVLTVGLTSYNISEGVIQKKVSEASLQTIKQAGQKLDLMYGQYEDLSMQILLDDELKKQLAEMDNVNKGSYDYLQLRQKVGEKLNVYSYSNKTLKALHLFRSNGEAVSSAGGTVSQDLVAGADWFKLIMENNGRAVWLETRPKGFVDSAAGSGAPTFAIGRVLKNTNTNNTQAILLMEINLDTLTKEIDIDMGEDGITAVVTPQLFNVWSNKQDEIAKESSLAIQKEQLADDSSAFLDKTKDTQVVYYKSSKTGWYLLGAMHVKELVKDAKAISNMTWVMAGIAAVIAVLIGFFVARMIGRPVVTLRDLMKEGEQGNLRVRMIVQSRDEIGQLGHSFNQMMEKITQLVQQTNRSAREVLETAGELSDASKKTATSAREIAVATEEIASGASSLAVESERGNELTHHIGIQMKNVVQSNVEMGTSASTVQKSSEQGIEYMSELINKTNATEAMTRSMVEKVDNLKESTRSIVKILDVLGNITKQTNILSLNATIEAARAGAAGKGFMVVADEIRKLADQSRQSIAIVGQIIETIQREIDETVNVLSQAYPIFQEQILSVKEADTIFKEVQTHMGGFIQQLSEVTESISQLDASQNVLSDAMANVSAVAQQSSATSEEVASLSSEQMSISNGLVKLSDKLEELSNSLQDSLSKFQV